MAIDFELREQAKDLYIIDGLTLEQVARETGISERTLAKWSSEEGWAERRREYRLALSEIKRSKVLLRRNLIEKALQSLDPQDIYAVARLELTEGKSSDIHTRNINDLREIRTPEDAIDALQEAVQHKINIMLSKPEELKLSAIKDMKKALELINEMKSKYTKPEERKRGLSDETVQDIKRRILGIS